MSKDYERQIPTSESLVYLVMIRLMLTRLINNLRARGKSWAIANAA